MRILSIETSCDETAVSIVEATGTFPHATYQVLGNALFSQIDIHREYGGVFPAVAKREHAKTLVPMLEKALKEAEMLKAEPSIFTNDSLSAHREILAREPGLGEMLIQFLTSHAKPDIDLIAVTHGPGLEPALWVGINFARALAHAWNMRVVPVNHMEGHILSSIFDGKNLPDLDFPALALLISGGHTELVRMENWASYELIGATRDDAIGEAFDKVARMLGLPYPGGPEISKLAKEAREQNITSGISLPRPMIDSKDYDFSFSGIKTAVRYAVQDRTLTHAEKIGIAREFEDAVTAVILRKVQKAVEELGIQTVIVGGGVSANNHIRTTLMEYFWKNYPTVPLYLPPQNLSTDNSIMIALAGHAHFDGSTTSIDTATVTAQGNLRL